MKTFSFIAPALALLFVIANASHAGERTHEQELCEQEGVCNEPPVDPGPPVIFVDGVKPVYIPVDGPGTQANSAAIEVNRAAIASQARDIANNTKGVAASLSVAAMQHNPNYEGLQTSFGLGYWDGQVGYGVLVGHRLADKVYGNVGLVGSGSEVGAVMSVTVQW